MGRDGGEDAGAIMHNSGRNMKPVHMIARLLLFFVGIGVRVEASRLNPHNERRTKS